MDQKLMYEFEKTIERITLTDVSMKALKVWRMTEEGTEIFEAVKELIDTVEEKQRHLSDIKSVLFMVANKF